MSEAPWAFVASGRTLKSIAFSQNAASYCSRPKAPQPDHDLHDDTPYSGLARIMVPATGARGNQTLHVSGLADWSARRSRGRAVLAIDFGMSFNRVRNAPSASLWRFTRKCHDGFGTLPIKRSHIPV
jgi:hypothetical protein